MDEGNDHTNMTFKLSPSKGFRYTWGSNKALTLTETKRHWPDRNGITCAVYECISHDEMYTVDLSFRERGF